MDSAFELCLVGLSHRTAPVGVRERYAVKPEDLESCLGDLVRDQTIDEACVISTCNRTEALVVPPPGVDPSAAVRRQLFRNLGEGEVYVFQGLHAIIHLFRVVSGLDSLVLGETEVLAQVRDAFSRARKSGAVGKTLQALLTHAMQTGKRVRNETDLGQGTLSVARVGVELAQRVFGGFERCRGLVVGAGETGMLVARHLGSEGMRHISFANRTVERARDAAREFAGAAFSLNELDQAIRGSDVVVVCVDGGAGLVDGSCFDPRGLSRRDRPLLVVDLSVPRAVTPDVAEISNLLLYDLDALEPVIRRNRESRDAASRACADILTSEVHKFLSLRTYAAFHARDHRAAAAVRGRARGGPGRCRWRSRRAARSRAGARADAPLVGHRAAADEGGRSPHALGGGPRPRVPTLPGEPLKFILATRKSPLALWQAHSTRDLLLEQVDEASAELLEIVSSGDQDQVSDLARFGSIGIFTAQVDRALLAGDAHVGVHSLKDMTTTLQDGIVLAGVLPRAAVEDALVSRDGLGFDELPVGARIATGSMRRRAMLRYARTDIELVGMRGNVGTRIEKLERGDAEALVLARAGLERLGWSDKITEVLPTERFLPAVGQGIVGLTCRADDDGTREALAQVRDRDAWDAALAERSLLRTLQGGCSAPIGCHARVSGDTLEMRARVLSVDGQTNIEAALEGSRDRAELLGQELAAELVERGAPELLEAARS